jgi:hypothetical protein
MIKSSDLKTTTIVYTKSLADPEQREDGFDIQHKSLLFASNMMSVFGTAIGSIL